MADKQILLSANGIKFQFLTEDGREIIDPRLFLQLNAETNKIDPIYLPDVGGIDEIETYPIA
jgi:hypothetical protein